MSDRTTSVGNPEDGEGAGQASATGGQQSVDLSAVLSRLESLEKKYSGVQKGTDKVNARVEERVNQVLSNPQIARILELANAGKSSEEIEERLLLDEMIQERKGKERSGSGGAGSPSGAVDAGISALVSEFGLDANDAEVAEALSKNDSVKLARLAVQKSKTPTPDPSTAPPLTQKTPAPNAADEIEKGYLAEMATVKRGDTYRAANIKSKWRQKARDAGFLLNV